MPEPEAGDPFRVLALDSAEAEYAALRLVAAVATLGGAAVIVALRPSVLGWVCALAGIAFAGMWLRMWARARRMTRRSDEHFLALAPEHLELSEGPERTRIPWEAIADVRVDEDRLVLEVARHEGDPLTIDPRYGGLGLYDLEQAVRRAREAARPDAT